MSGGNASESSFTRNQKLILVSTTFLQLLATLFSAINTIYAHRYYISSTDDLFWKRLALVLQQMDSLWILAAIIFTIILIWGVIQDKYWVLPFILILLIYASLYVVWRSLPWVWAIYNSFYKTSNLVQFLILACCFTAIFVPKSGFKIKDWDLTRVSMSVILGVAVIYIYGHFCFCCPQYAYQPPKWWVYFDITGLWQTRETGLLTLWSCYAGILGISWLYKKTYKSKRQPADRKN